MQTLRQLRRERKLTLDEVAEKVGVTASQLSRIERDGNASVQTALALEQWSDRLIPAETLSPDVAKARAIQAAA